MNGLRETLDGKEGACGKKNERETLTTQLTEDLWKAKKNLGLNDAFKGLNNDRKKFRDRYLIEASSNNAILRATSELEEDAATVYSESLIKATPLPIQSSTKVSMLEESAILKKLIIGKKDVDIAALIKTLGNSNWVQQGRHYFDQLKDQCPFCQQKTNAAFKESLDEYFDEAYVADLAGIDEVFRDYTESAKKILEVYEATAALESPFLDSDSFKKDIETLRLTLRSNAEQINAKRKEPSDSVTLDDTVPLFEAVNVHLKTANDKIKSNNDTIDNIEARKNELSTQVWRRLLEDTKTIYTKYASEAGGLDKAIMSLTQGIEKETSILKEKRTELEKNERMITSVKPTIDDINKLLKSFGFTNFHLVEGTSNGFYEVKRLDGSDAKGTLSEGEKSFITFLYFYHLVGGSFNSSGATNHKVVVFDDPVSSLDADILFIVCNLIKVMISQMRSSTSPIKQVFILTHNIYFHKEVTFDKKRSGDSAKNDETFWVIRKTSKNSELISSQENPIKSSYELLWREVRRKPPSDTAIQNIMRRILEHYFKFYGGFPAEKIIDNFEGKEKMICNTLLSWVNDGSHFSTDDLYMACDSGQVDRYLNVFQRIFEGSDHGGHFKMMMGDDYVPIPEIGC